MSIRLIIPSIHSFIHSRIYKAPLQEIYSDAPPAQPRRYRSVLSNLQNALSLFLGMIRISKGSPFQVEGPTMENARRCLVAVLARGTMNSMYKYIVNIFSCRDVIPLLFDSSPFRSTYYIIRTIPLEVLSALRIYF